MILNKLIPCNKQTKEPKRSLMNKETFQIVGSLSMIDLQMSICIKKFIKIRLRN